MKKDYEPFVTAQCELCMHVAMTWAWITPGDLDICRQFNKCLNYAIGDVYLSSKAEISIDRDTAAVSRSILIFYYFYSVKYSPINLYL